MQKSQTARTALRTFSGIAAGVALFVAANVFVDTAFPGARLDLTEDRLYSLSEGTKTVLKDLAEPVSLRFYYSEQLGRDIPAYGHYAKRVRELLEEYAHRSGGKIHLEIVQPEPFSDEEDRAVASGLQGVPIDQTGSPVYFGLVGQNAIDDQEIIPFFQPDQEEKLEYDLTKMIYDLSTPTKPVLGLLSSLPLQGGPAPGRNPMAMMGMGQQGMTPPWLVYDQLDQLFDIHVLSTDLGHVPEDVRLLMVVHPTGLSAQSEYAIDQFVMAGGHALIFVDPHAESQAPSRPGMPPLETQSDLPHLFQGWGLVYDKDQVAGDRIAAQKVNAPGHRRPVDYLAWMEMGPSNLNRDDFVTANLDRVNIASAGFFNKAEGAKIDLKALLFTSLQADSFPAQDLQGMPDPVKLLEAFAPDVKPFLLGARVQGSLSSAFPDGRPEAPEQDSPQNSSSENPGDRATQVGPGAHLAQSTGPANLIIFADTDVLHDSQWVQRQNFFGQAMALPFAQNGDLIVNAVENLMGSNALISLRSRGVSARPFEKVEDMARQADAQFRAQEKELTEKLEKLDAQLANLRRGEEGAAAGLLTAEQQKIVEGFQQEMLATRKDLRNVQRALNEDIDALESQLWFFTIAAMPLFIALLALVQAFWQRARRRRSLQMG